MKLTAAVLIALVLAVLVASSAGATYRLTWPQSEFDAASACYLAEREARGIPGPGGTTPGSTIDDYIAWWNANAGTQERADWHAAYERCQDRHLTSSPWSR